MQSSLRPDKYPTFSGLTLGKVYAIRPEANMVDLLMFDGSILEKVQVMVPFSSSKSGVSGLPDPKYQKAILKRDDPLGEAQPTEESDVIAVVAHLGGSIIRPIVIGFLFPEINEVLCDRTQVGNEDGTMYLWKHPSNVYVRVAKANPDDNDGSPEIEISHPSGLFIKIGKDSSALTEIENYDKDVRPFKKLNPDNNTADPSPEMSIYHPSGNLIKIDKDGNAEIVVKGNLDETIEGDVTRLIKGNLEETVEGDSTIEVQGDKTETITGAWKRESTTSIKDEAPTIDHN